MKAILTFAALLLSASAFAQAARIDCKLLGTIEGTKLWAGECLANQPSRNEARNEIRGRIDTGSRRRSKTRPSVEPPPPAEEKSWWDFR
jgi:hypothetical protein